MKKLILGLFASIISFQGACSENNIINSISVFVTEEQSKNVFGCDVNCHIYEIDATENILQSYFGELPNNIDDAYEVVQAKFATSEWKNYENRVIESQQTVIKAFELGVQKYPAIVLNDTDVIYGTTDVIRAINDFFNDKEKLND